MAKEGTQDGGSFPINLNSLLAVLTLAGGILLVSQKLTSDRPVAPAGDARSFIGEQTLEARLWEDPFKRDEGRQEGGRSEENTLDLLRTQIRNRGPTNVLLFPVMIYGGNYSEARESRIRSRYAIVSALGRSGYAPEDAEHIGAATVKWATETELNTLKNPTNRDSRTWLGYGPWGTNGTARLILRYEWYRSRTFYPGGGADGRKPNVLLLWLDDSFFEDEPLLRLPLILASLAASNDAGWDPSALPDVKLIGPRRSSTLRAMLPGPLTGETSFRETNAALWSQATGVLHHVTLYSATSSAMDEMLVTNASAFPREAVGTALRANGFADFHNFAVTDAQLAGEVLMELKLRAADLTETNYHHHLVLISEWDTFYARMLSLTYAAELAHGQNPAVSPAEFIYSYSSGTNGARQMPPNFHSFVYLRGLDGQTVGNDSGSAAGGSDKNDAGRTGPVSIEDLRTWRPDENKAEGQAQFDYLSRLGDQLAALKTQLRRENKGQISAIGIVGSDVYDTLLLLQALRERFSDILFFTTDLDARFWDPKESAWARNLIVTSGYGLSLHPALQEGVAPFRDSEQTAQFAAALAALGNRYLESITNVAIPPRRFEIGNRTAVNLSVQTNAEAMHTAALLHPPIRSETVLSPPWKHILGGCLLLVAVALLGMEYFGALRRLTIEAPQFQAQALFYTEEDVGGVDGALALLGCLEEKAKGNAGHDAMAVSLHGELIRKKPDLFPLPFGSTHQAAPATVPSPEAHDPAPAAGFTEKYHHYLLQKQNEEKAAHDHNQEWAERSRNAMHQLIDFLNDLLRRETLVPAEGDVKQTGLFDERLKEEYRLWRLAQKTRGPFLPVRPHRRLFQARQFLDALLLNLSKTSHPSGAGPIMDKGKPGHEIEIEEDTLKQAESARRAGFELYRMRHDQIRTFWSVTAIVVGFGIILGWRIWRDSYRTAEGEPFSLTNGTSAWPAELVRLAAVVLAFAFIIHAYQRLRTTMFELTRRFRLPLARFELTRRSWLPRAGDFVMKFQGPNATPVPQSTVQAADLWEVYQHRGLFLQRLRRVVYPLVVYVFGFAFGVSLLGNGTFFRPLRGHAVACWDNGILWACILVFLFLTFMTIDAARLCSWFIQHLCEAPTRYPPASSRHFARLRGNVDKEFLDEWIDLQLIAELTERVGRLVYYPSFVYLLLLVARNDWWDHWTWPIPLVIIFICNLVLALASVIILQRSARKAKQAAEATLEAKIKQLQAANAPSKSASDATQAERLLDEIRNLRRGAFAPFWENPVLGAVLVPSGGTALLQLLIWFMGR